MDSNLLRVLYRSLTEKKLRQIQRKAKEINILNVVIKEERGYIFDFFTNEFTLKALVFTWSRFVLLDSTAFLSPSVFMPESA